METSYIVATILIIAVAWYYMRHQAANLDPQGPQDVSLDPQAAPPTACPKPACGRCAIVNISPALQEKLQEMSVRANIIYSKLPYTGQVVTDDIMNRVKAAIRSAAWKSMKLTNGELGAIDAMMIKSKAANQPPTLGLLRALMMGMK